MRIGQAAGTSLPAESVLSPGGFSRVHGGAGGGLVRVPGGVDDGVVRPLGRQRLLGEDRVHRALGLARAAVDALVRIDEQLPIGAFLVVDAIDRTDGHARDVEHVDARLGDHVGHPVPPVGCARSRGGRSGRGKSVPPCVDRERRTHGADVGPTNRTGMCMPFSQWPAMWQPTTSGSDVSGTVQVTSRRWPDATTIRSPAMLRRHADRGRRAGWRIGGRGLGDLPCVLHRRVADDRLVDVQATVDHVQVHRLAGHDVEDRRVEHVVAGDEVHVARRVARARDDRRGARRRLPTRTRSRSPRSSLSGPTFVGWTRRESMADGPLCRASRPPLTRPRPRRIVRAPSRRAETRVRAVRALGHPDRHP